MRQYEQDLAKRLYQARVRASQPAASSPAPHLRSEGQTHGIMGVCWLAFSGIGVIFAGPNDAFPFGKALRKRWQRSSAGGFLHLSAANLLFLFARFCSFVFRFFQLPLVFLRLPSPSHSLSSVCSLLLECCFYSTFLFGLTLSLQAIGQSEGENLPAVSRSSFSWKAACCAIQSSLLV